MVAWNWSLRSSLVATVRHLDGRFWKALLCRSFHRDQRRLVGRLLRFGLMKATTTTVAPSACRASEPSATRSMVWTTRFGGTISEPTLHCRIAAVLLRAL